jgi:cytoskeletal protein RodZ
MPRIRKPDSEKTKSFMKRAGWMLLVILFVTTSLGVGVAAFWQATHQPDTNTSQTTPPPSTADNSCAGGTEANQEKLALPEVYKPSGKVNQLQACVAYGVQNTIYSVKNTIDEHGKWIIYCLSSCNSVNKNN